MDELYPVELIHCIQSLLPVKEAARTCVLSKTWSNAWSTIPHLRFHKTSIFPNEEKETDYMMFMDRTMSKYVQYNIPIESVDMRLDIKLASFAFKWIPTLADQICFKKLIIHICYESDSNLILPDEIFSGKNLHTLYVGDFRLDSFERISVSRNPVIKCVSLRVLELLHVMISEDVLDSLISTCILLEKINLSIDNSHLKSLKIRNLRYLQELKLTTIVSFDVLKIDDVPNLCLFSYYVLFAHCQPIKTFNMTSLTSVTELSLLGVTIDVAFLDMIKSKLHSLEILDLEIQNWTPKRLDFTSSSLKKLKLKFIETESRPVDIQVYAPKLHDLSYMGNTMPSLMFPSSNAPEYIKLELELLNHVDHSFYLRMREILDLSSKFDIYYHINEPLNIDDDDDGEITLPIPSTNVQQLLFCTSSHEELKVFHTLLKVCHPKYITIHCIGDDYSRKYWYRDFFEHLRIGIMAKKTCNLKDIEFKNCRSDKWEILTDSCITTILDKSDGWGCSLELKPNW